MWLMSACTPLSTLSPTPRLTISRRASRIRSAGTKLKIAVELVRRAVQAHLPFRAVVADSFYGEDRGFKGGLRELGVGYVLAHTLARLVACRRSDRLVPGGRAGGQMEEP